MLLPWVRRVSPSIHLVLGPPRVAIATSLPGPHSHFPMGPLSGYTTPTLFHVEARVGSLKRKCPSVHLLLDAISDGGHPGCCSPRGPDSEVCLAQEPPQVCRTSAGGRCLQDPCPLSLRLPSTGGPLHSLHWTVLGHPERSHQRSGPAPAPKSRGAEITSRVVNAMFPQLARHGLCASVHLQKWEERWG